MSWTGHSASNTAEPPSRCAYAYALSVRLQLCIIGQALQAQALLIKCLWASTASHLEYRLGRNRIKNKVAICDSLVPGTVPGVNSSEDVIEHCKVFHLTGIYMVLCTREQLKARFLVDAK